MEERMRIDISSFEILNQAQRMGAEIRVSTDNDRHYVDYYNKSYVNKLFRHPTTYTLEWDPMEVKMQQLDDFLRWAGLRVAAKVEIKI
jgi:hypothetical protein